MRPMTELPRPVVLDIQRPTEWQEKFVDPKLVRNLLGAKLQAKNYLPGVMLSETFGEILSVHGQRVADKRRTGDVRAVVNLGTQGSTDRYLVVERFTSNKGNIVVWPLELKRKRFVRTGVSSKRHKFNPIGTEHVVIIKSERDGDMARYFYPKIMLGMHEKGAYMAMKCIHSWLKEPDNNEATD